MPSRKSGLLEVRKVPTTRDGSRLYRVAYDHIKEHLLVGAYEPGARLSVVEIGAALGMSRQPILTALKQLATEELVEVVPQVGCLAARHDPDEVADFFRFFAACEGLVAEVAAQRANASQNDELRKAIGENAGFDKARVNARQRRDFTRRIHGIVHAMADSAYMSRKVRVLWDRSDYYIATHIGGNVGTITFPDMVEGYSRLAEAIRAGDAAAARALMEAQILKSGRRFASV